MQHDSQLRCFIALIVSVLCLGSTTAIGADKYGRRSAHPYLTYSGANIQKLKERIANEPMIAEAWERMLADAKRAVDSNAQQGGRRRLGGSNELLCLAYRMTGDKRFGERAKASLFRHHKLCRAIQLAYRRSRLTLHLAESSTSKTASVSRPPSIALPATVRRLDHPKSLRAPPNLMRSFRPPAETTTREMHKQILLASWR